MWNMVEINVNMFFECTLYIHACREQNFIKYFVCLGMFSEWNWLPNINGNEVYYKFKGQKCIW